MTEGAESAGSTPAGKKTPDVAPPTASQAIRTLRSREYATDTGVTRRVTEPALGGVWNETPWVGGKPRNDFSGATEPAFHGMQCLRPQDPSSAIKTYRGCVEPPEAKFEGDDSACSLQTWLTHVDSHMVRTGMDALFWMPDPMEPTKLLNLIKDYAKVSLEDVQNFITTKLTPLNCEHITQDLRSSAQWMIASISVDMCNELVLKRPQIVKAVGPVALVLTVKLNQSNSAAALAKVEEDFVKLSIKDFPGEDISKLTTKILECTNRLERNNMLRANAPLDVCDKFIECTVKEFRFDWLARRPGIEDLCELFAGKNAADVTRITGKEPPKIPDMCYAAEDRFHGLDDAFKWPPRTQKTKKQ